MVTFCECFATGQALLSPHRGQMIGCPNAYKYARELQPREESRKSSGVPFLDATVSLARRRPFGDSQGHCQ